MAFLFQDPNQEDEEAKKAAAGQPSGSVDLQTPSTGNGGSILGGGAPQAGPDATGSGPGQTTTPTSSGWTNLRAYLDANQTQAGDLADKVAGGIKTTGDQAKSAVDTGIGNYNSQLNPVTSNAQDLTTRANANPVEFAKNPNDVQALKGFESGTFSGPDKFDTTPGYGDIATKAQSGTDLAKMAGTEGGQRTLLHNLEPNLSQGGIDLNQMLLAGVPGAGEKLKTAAAPYANLRSYLSDETTKANATRDKAAADFGADSDTVKNQFVAPQTKSLMDLENDINGRVTNASQDFNKDQAIKDLQSYMGGGGDLSDQEKGLFGVAGSGYDNSYLSAVVRDAISSKLNPTFATPDYIQKGVDYLINGGQAEDTLRGALDPIKPDLWKYSNDPLTKLRGEGAGNDPNWMENFFGGTQLSSGNPSTASVASPEEAARILALQQLIDGSSSFLTPEQLAQAGTYRPAQIGRLKATPKMNQPPSFFADNPPPSNEWWPRPV